MLFPEVFDEIFKPASAQPLMNTDVKETDTGYQLAVELPGIQKENVRAELHDGYLTVSATTEQNNDQKNENGNYIRKERFSGSYSRSFYVGDAFTEQDVQAKFKDGVLYLDLPKKESAVPQKRYIAIEG